MPAIAGAVCEASWQRSPQQVALVVEDVHEVPAGSEASALLAAIVDGLRANGHIVLAGRVPPPLPLARLDAEGRAVRLDEAAAFIARLQEAESSGEPPAHAEASAAEQVLQRVPAEQLVAELQHRGWVVVQP
jgi:hypothetical protein